MISLTLLFTAYFVIVRPFESKLDVNLQIFSHIMLGILYCMMLGLYLIGDDTLTR